MLFIDSIHKETVYALAIISVLLVKFNENSSNKFRMLLYAIGMTLGYITMVIRLQVPTI